jgi:phosphomethylpyrimidine synthase
MRISHDIRGMANGDQPGEELAIEEGMKQKAEEFVNDGSKIYR